MECPKNTKSIKINQDCKEDCLLICIPKKPDDPVCPSGSDCITLPEPCPKDSMCLPLIPTCEKPQHCIEVVVKCEDGKCPECPKDETCIVKPMKCPAKTLSI